MTSGTIYIQYLDRKDLLSCWDPFIFSTFSCSNLWRYVWVSGDGAEDVCDTETVVVGCFFLEVGLDPSATTSSRHDGFPPLIFTPINFPMTSILTEMISEYGGEKMEQTRVKVRLMSDDLDSTAFKVYMCVESLDSRANWLASSSDIAYPSYVTEPLLLTMSLPRGVNDDFDPKEWNRFKIKGPSSFFLASWLCFKAY